MFAAHALLVVLMFCRQLDAAGELDQFFYSAHQWLEYPQECPACDWHQSYPDSGLYNRTSFWGDLPGIGYPYHKALIKGVNDTLSAYVGFRNRTRVTDYDMTGKEVKEWFEPVVYQLFVLDSSGPKLRGASEIGFQMRYWYEWPGPMAAPAKIPAGSSNYSVRFDIWNLPEGRFQLCFVPTELAPGDFHGIAYGYVFEYYPAHSLADTINAYEACFLRAEDDTNYTAADSWADSILLLHKDSVPGNALKARSQLALGDTAEAKSAYEYAINSMENGYDTLMPDSTARPLTGAEKNYLAWMQVMLDHNLKSLGP